MRVKAKKPSNAVSEICGRVLVVCLMLVAFPRALAHAAELELSVIAGFSVTGQFLTPLDGPEGLVLLKGDTPAGDRLLAPHGNDCDACTIESYDTAGTHMGSIPTGWGEVRGIDLLPNGNLVIASLSDAAGTVDVVSSNTPLIPIGEFTPPFPFRQRFLVEIDTSGATDPNGLFLNLTGELPEATVTAGPTFPLDPSDIEIEIAHLIDQLESVFSMNPIQAGLAFDPNTGSVLYVGEEGPDPSDPDSRIVRLEVEADQTTYTLASEFPAGPVPFDDVSGMDFIPDTTQIISVDDTSGGASSMFLWETDGTLVAMSTEIFADLTDPNVQTQLDGVCPAGGCTDPEGVAFDEATGNVWVAFETDRAIVGFNVNLVTDGCGELGGDTDGDTLCDDEDPCKQFANTLPLVMSGFSGIPDECLCGDFDGDGFHSATDAAAINDCAAFISFACVPERDEVAEPVDGFYSATDADLVNRVAAFLDPAYTLTCARRPEGTCGGLTGVSCF
jgi:hypothetical protein